MSNSINYRELALEALYEKRDYVRRLEYDFESREERRRLQGTPVIAFVGHGRAGKDESALAVARLTDLQHGGSVSAAVLPLVAYAQRIPETQAWESRHERREFWREFCDALRWDDPTLLARMALGRGDMLTGIRARAELWSAWGEQLIDAVIWVERLEIDDDPTLAYDLHYLMRHLPKLGSDARNPRRGLAMITNDGPLESLERTLEYLIEHHKLAQLRKK